MVIEYLVKELSQRSKKNPAYSLRSFAKSIGINSGVLSAILNKKRPLTVSTAKKIIDALNLDSKTRSKLLQSLVSAEPQETQGSYHSLSEDLFQAVQNWEHFAILSMLESKSTALTPRAIAQRLKISQATAMETLETLKRIGLIKLEAGKLKPTHKNLSTTHDIPSQALRHAHRQHLQKAIEALEDQSVDERDFSGVTMAISKKKLPIAKKLITQFRRDLCDLLEGGSRDEVYRLNVQLFSLENNNGRQNAGLK